MKNLYVVCHAQSRHHVEALVGGWYDAELTELGLVQAAAIARRVRELIPADAPVELYSSDLRRAFQTAEAIADVFGVPIEASPDLREKSYGEAGGKPQAWLDERFVFPPPAGNRLDHWEGVPGAESRRELATRIYRAVDHILASSCSHQVIVTHGGALTFIVAAWIKMPLEDAGYIHLRSSSGGITHLLADDRYHDRGIVKLNDTDHLQQEGYPSSAQ